MFRFIRAWLLYTWGGLHRYFGNQNSMVSEHERAVHYFTRAYEVDPSFLGARRQRAILLSRELRRFQEAIADFDALLVMDPGDGEALLNRGLALQEIGRYREALRDIEAYLQLLQQDEYRAEAGRIAVYLREIIAETDT